ncbi:DUF1186 domain-containing protein [uncultured Methylobacterium sp.]|jgi:uncharacterized protein|uniref:DUF1186 domain-containing protein n=1 Tax=uncultured Methylobacterium sp. TaxID=157278 RepID=UPI00260415B7|nr:DUF1186 domain-containing protein [uncultured Methylobacterium sp.]
MDRDLIEALSSADAYPEEALRRAIAAPDAVAAPVLAALDKVAAGKELSDGEVNLLFWGLHVLAVARDTRAYRPLMRLLSGPQAPIDRAFDDDLPETLPRMLAGLFDGEAGPLFALAARRTADSMLRTMMLGTLAFLTAEGRVDAGAMRDFLIRFDDERLAEDDDDAWVGWTDAISLLGLTDLADRADAAWRDGRISPDQDLEDEYRSVLAEAVEQPDDRTRFEDYGYCYLTDLDAEFAPLPDDEDPDYVPLEPERNPYRHVGRNDPCPCGSGRKFKKCCLDTVAAR